MSSLLNRSLSRVSVSEGSRRVAMMRASRFLLWSDWRVVIYFSCIFIGHVMVAQLYGVLCCVIEGE